MQHVPLVEVTRGSHVESIHYGSVAVVNCNGDVLYRAGDPDFLTFTRSTLKPFQALPFVQSGGPAQFGLNAKEVALLCASHSGEPMHIDAVQSMLSKAGCTEHQLRCGCHAPLYFAATGQSVPSGKSYNQLYNNCSGKHAGFLAYCVQHELSLANYLDPGHPLQRAIRTNVASIVNMPEEDLKLGIDGCSAPNYAMPLSRLALAYARLAQAGSDSGATNALGVLYDAMTMHPEMVSGTKRMDLALMQTTPVDWVAKGGAEGVQAIGVRSAGLGIAIKVADGSKRGLETAIVAVLQQLGLLSAPANSVLAPWTHPEIVNVMGLHTGEIRPVLQLVKT
jgi:L-asparaginase II